MRGEEDLYLQQQQSHSCPGVQVKRGIPVIWNVKVTRTQSPVFLVVASMEGNISSTCYGWYVEEVSLFYPSRTV